MLQFSRLAGSLLLLRVRTGSLDALRRPQLVARKEALEAHVGHGATGSAGLRTADCALQSLNLLFEVRSIWKLLHLGQCIGDFLLHDLSSGLASILGQDVRQGGPELGLGLRRRTGGRQARGEGLGLAQGQDLLEKLLGPLRCEDYTIPGCAGALQLLQVPKLLPVWVGCEATRILVEQAHSRAAAETQDASDLVPHLSHGGFRREAQAELRARLHVPHDHGSRARAFRRCRAPCRLP
mmetsp:Transcript_102040/g.297632  ORF Transcript_102040/g.297632 Transcript_102040/m.297632 type:complete len:238 (+) Transcript_102040:895-1608(+)